MSNNKSIAIIGMSASLPQANDHWHFFENLGKKKSLIRSFPVQRRQDAAVFISDLYHHYQKAHIDIEYAKGGYLNRVDHFDAQYFGISPAEAKVMDPCQRVFLEQCIKAIEDAAYAPEALRGTNTGVYLGFMPDYRPFNYKDLLLKKWDQNFDLQVPGNLPAVIASRISYHLDFKGPSYCIDTACSSVLSALYLAVGALRNGNIDLALVGGVKLVLSPIRANGQRISIESADGHCKPFEHSADGVGIGEGAGAILLKPLDHAVRHGDHIYAVIEGVASNQDGRSLGIAAPNGRSQAAAIEKAWEDAKVEPEKIELLEAHGTGTALGDPIEVDALKAAFANHTERKQFCYLTSVKSNLGHLYEASGVPSLIKTILSVYLGKKMPLVRFASPNRKILFPDTPFYVGVEPEPWPTQDRYAGINSFGMSGTNCHVVIRNHIANMHTDELPENILVISAKSKESLRGLLNDYRSYLRMAKYSLTNICYTAAVARSHYKYRLAFVVKDKTAAVRAIDQALGDLDFALSEQGANDLCHGYKTGESIDWAEFYGALKVRRVPIPTYHFEKTRHWLDFPTAYTEEIAALNAHHFEVGYEPINWQYNHIEPRKDVGIILNDTMTSKRSQEIRQTMPQATLFTNINEFMSHLGTLNSSDALPPIMYCAMTTDDSRTEVGKFRDLQRAMAEISRFRNPPDFTIICRNATSCSAKDAVNPFNAALLSFVKSVSRETAIRCRGIDVEDGLPWARVSEIPASEHDHFLTVVTSKGDFHEVFRKSDFVSSQPKGPVLRKGGCYVLTGGTGGIALEIASYLIKEHDAYVYLLSRSGRIKSAYEEQFADALQHANLRVMTCNFDNYNDVYKTFAAISGLHSHSINGVYHCAGVPSTHLIVDETNESFREVTSPKIEGTLTVIKAISDLRIKPDFVALFSSVATLFPAVGQSTYALANGFMDGLALSAIGRELNLFSTSWVAWKEIGMAKDWQTNVDATFKAIPTDVAIASLHKAIAHGLKHVLIGELNLARPTIARALESYGISFDRTIDETLRSIEKEQENVMGVRQDVTLTGRSPDEYSSAEKTIAAIWGYHLGYATIDVNAKLYQDLGADSLIATQIASEISQSMNVKLSISDIIDASLQQVAWLIEQRCVAKEA